MHIQSNQVRPEVPSGPLTILFDPAHARSEYPVHARSIFPLASVAIRQQGISVLYHRPASQVRCVPPSQTGIALDATLFAKSCPISSDIGYIEHSVV